MPQPVTMKAAVFDRYGPPETLSLETVPVPQPGPGEVRIRVKASTVGRTDTSTLRAHPFFARAMTGLLRPRMRILGMDFAGVVDATGPGATRFQPGDRVFGIVSERFGAHAEYLILPADAAVTHIPPGIPFHAAVVGEGAWYAHATTMHLREGMRCLVYGASGAIGTAAVQLAKAQGAEVTAVVGTRHLDLARRLGADRIINYEAEDFTAIGDRFDLVFDAVGKTSWFACRRLLTPHGVFAATDLGPGWSNIWLSLWTTITGSKRIRVPYPDDAPGFIEYLASLMDEKRFQGVFDRTYPLDDVVEAFRYVERAQKTGIVVIEIDAPDPA